MKNQRAVTEADFRLPEFRTAKLEDYEFRPGDDKPVRKDRWQTGIFAIASAVGLLSKRDGFEVSQVVAAVELLTKDGHSWETEDYPELPAVLDLKLKDGSVLLGVSVARTGRSYHTTWSCLSLAFDVDFVVGWRMSAPVATADE
jgi:hypothetical protein